MKATENIRIMMTDEQLAKKYQEFERAEIQHRQATQKSDEDLARRLSQSSIYSSPTYDKTPTSPHSNDDQLLIQMGQKV